MKADSDRASRAQYGDSRFFRARIIGLAVACPYNQGNPAHCPICRIRELPPIERYRWVMSLQLVELERIVNAHEDCLRATERSGNPVSTDPSFRGAISLGQTPRTPEQPSAISVTR